MEGTNGVVEVKCPYVCRSRSLEEGVASRSLAVVWKILQRVFLNIVLMTTFTRPKLGCLSVRLSFVVLWFGSTNVSTRSGLFQMNPHGVDCSKCIHMEWIVPNVSTWGGLFQMYPHAVDCSKCIHTERIVPNISTRSGLSQMYLH